MLKGASAAVLLHLLTAGPARARHGAAAATQSAGLHLATYLAVERPANAYGIDVLRGLELWASTLPATSEAVVAVGSGPPDGDAVEAWYQLAARRADVLVAPYGSALSRVAFDVAEALRVPCIAPSAGDPGLWDGGRRWSVGMLEPTPTFFDGVLALAARAPAARAGDVALVYRDDPFSRSVMAGAERRARALGFAGVAHHRFRDAQQRSAAARAATAPTVLGTGYQPGTPGDGFLDDAVALARALPRTASGVTALGVGAADPAFGEQAGTAAEGIVGVTGWRPYLATPGNPAFVAAFRARWHAAPTAHVAQGYATGQVLERAADRASLSAPDPVPGGVADPGSDRARRNEALRAALHTLATETVFGCYGVTAHGRQSAHRPALVRWRNGRVTPLDAPPLTGC